MIAFVTPLFTALVLCGSAEQTRNIWAQHYKTRTPADMAALFENPSRAVFRYRVAIVSLMQLKPGMVAADIGAGSGFLARIMAGQVGPSGKVIATELDPSMVAFMNDRAGADGIQNFHAVQGQLSTTGFIVDAPKEGMGPRG